MRVIPDYQQGIIRGHLRDGKSISAVAALTGHSRDYVRSVKNNQTGPVRHRAYRKLDKAKAVAQRRKLIKRYATSTRKLGDRTLPAYPSSVSIAKALKLKNDIEVTPQTVMRDLKALGLKCFTRQKRPFYAGDKKTIAKRDRFGKRMKAKYTKPQLKTKFVVSDEHPSSSNDHSRKTQYAFKIADVLPLDRKAPRNCVRTMVWAAIGHNYKSPLVFIDTSKDPVTKRARRQTAPKYIDKCLKKSGLIKHLQKNKKIFLQDGASCHTAKMTKQFLSDQAIEWLEDYPPYSPMLNPIEPLWSLLERRRSEGFPPAKTEAELQRQLKKVWAKISMTEINRHVGSFATAIDRCVQSNGHR